MKKQRAERGWKTLGHDQPGQLPTPPKRPSGGLRSRYWLSPARRIVAPYREGCQGHTTDRRWGRSGGAGRLPKGRVESNRRFKVLMAPAGLPTCLPAIPWSPFALLSR
ncbi:hypothetical protein GQ53DRAFT_352529 [Thozetella sp. PMI_491]|nr:hypothetical protein GQ53DRAFT_352529 [Thozetella sp. PMI_491]